jgi:hypothetical protein
VCKKAAGPPTFFAEDLATFARSRSGLGLETRILPAFFVT